MKPQSNEPCNNCKHWNDKSGCEMDRYNSSSMIIFGFCGFQKPNNDNNNEKEL